MSGRYDDIIGLPRPALSAHPRMPLSARAAQFVPFAALTGYEAAVRETARLTERRLELDEHERERLNERLRLLAERLDEGPAVTVTWFVPDDRKAGGAYVTAAGTVKKLDPIEGVAVLEGGRRIPMEDISRLESELFDEL